MTIQKIKKSLFSFFKAACQRAKSDLKVRYKPSLFQHVGVQSSLKGKTQKVKVIWFVSFVSVQ